MKKQRIPRKVKKAKQRTRKRWMSKMLDYAVVSVNTQKPINRLAELYVGGIDAYDINSISKSYGVVNREKYSKYLSPEYKNAMNLLQNEFTNKVEK